MKQFKPLGEKKTMIELNRQLNTDKAKLLKEIDRIKGQLEEALTYKDAFRLSERALDKKTKELAHWKKIAQDKSIYPSQE